MGWATHTIKFTDVQKKLNADKADEMDEIIFKKSKNYDKRYICT